MRIPLWKCTECFSVMKNILLIDRSGQYGILLLLKVILFMLLSLERIAGGKVQIL